MSAQRKISSFLLNSKIAEAGDGKPESASDSEELAETKNTTLPSKKQPRAFQMKWLQRHTWLEFTDGDMYCNPCSKTKKENPFTAGCSNFRTSTLERHEKSRGHVEALKEVSLQTHFKRSVQNAEASIQTSDDAQTVRHITQLRTVYMMSTNGIPPHNFVEIMELQSENGCDGADNYYKKPEIVSEMETVLCDQIEKQLLSSIDESPFYGLMLDETCDITVDKKLVVYIRYIKGGKAVVSYLGNQKIQDCTAEGIKLALCEFLAEKGIIKNDDYSKLIALGTDGAAVMVGCRNGLGVKLRYMNDMLVQVHCIAHRLNLAASQASKGIDYMEDYKRYINMLYRFYTDSSVRYDKLRELQELLHGKSQQVPEGTSVRWLSVESAVKMIFKNFDAIIMSLENEKDKTGKASGLWNYFSTSLFILTTALLIDVLTVIGILSLTFQKDSVNLSAIRHNVNSCVSTLRDMKNQSQTVSEVLNELGAVQPGQKTTYRDIQLTDNAVLRTRFQSNRTKFIDQLIENLQQRFPGDDLNILECFDLVFNPKQYPEVHRDLQDHAHAELQKLCEVFQTLINVGRCKGQFLQFKHFTFTYRQVHNFEKYIELLINDYSEVYPDFAKLAAIAIVIPVSSAPCERGFSQQNVLKSKLRNRLNPDRLNRLLMIRIVGPPRSEFDFRSAARAFGALKQRKK